MNTPKISVRMVAEQNQANLSEFKITAFREFGNPEPLAFASIKAFGNFVVLHSVIVSSQHRRKGVGTQIVRWAVDFTRKEWPSRTLYVNAIPYGAEATTQEELFGFYSRFGFQRTPDHPYECKLYPSTK